MRGKPFRMVSVMQRGGARAEALQAAREWGIECSLSCGASYPRQDNRVFPLAVVFDPEGKEIFQGPPAAARSAAEKAVAAAPRIYLGPEPFVRLRDLAGQVESGKAPGPAVATLRKKAREGDPAERGEARRALAGVKRHVQARRELLDYERRTDPDQALADLKGFAKTFAGDEIGARAAEAARKDVSDPALGRLRKALKDLDAQEKRLEGLPPCKPHRQQGKKGAQSGCAECAKVNADALAAVKRALSGIEQTCPDTAASERARSLLESWSPCP